ncbi:MAG: Smr/MutS family protein [Rhodospirillales bacterium]|nr:Smr/MutS family protein [Rhodospirillales bacterium]
MSQGKDQSPLDDEDARLWQRVTQSVDPLPGRERPERPAPSDVLDAEGDTPSLLDDKPHHGTTPSAPHRPRTANVRGEIVLGEVHNVDKRQAQRFRRGQMTIDARIDFHGMRQQEAHAALDDFIARAHGRGCRCVLVITGKGQKAPLEECTGVLRAQLPRWLNAPSNRSRVLAVSPAQPWHGGEGAFYVLLKKSR